MIEMIGMSGENIPVEMLIHLQNHTFLKLPLLKQLFLQWIEDYSTFLDVLKIE